MCENEPLFKFSTPSRPNDRTFLKFNNAGGEIKNMNKALQRHRTPEGIVLQGVRVHGNFCFTANRDEPAMVG